MKSEGSDRPPFNPSTLQPFPFQLSASDFQLYEIPPRLLALSLLACVAAAAPGKSQQLTTPDQVPDGLAKSDWSSIRAAYEAGRHSFQPTATGWQARNPGQQWTTQFDKRGFVATPRDGGWTWGLELQSYGFPGAERAISGVPAVKADGQRLTYQWDAAVQEWWVNDKRGLEHGFTVARRPDVREVLDCGSPLPLSAADARTEQKRQRAGAVQDAGASSPPLTFLLATRGSLTPAITDDAKGVLFRDAAGATVLNYTGLKVWDADGKVLTSHFELADSQLSTLNSQPTVRLLVDERGARYPLTIDPIAQQAYVKITGTGSGALNDEFGTSVAVSGDTVVVGAKNEDSNTTGVNSTPNELANNAGAAYIFTGFGPAAAAPTVTAIAPISGSTAGGTSVTITGTDFTGATGVTIGGTAATGITVVNATTITCTTPAGTAGTASVIVTTPNGVNTANTLFTYAAPPAGNTAPSVTFAQSTVTVAEDAGAQSTASFATFSPGPPSESAQTLVGYTVTVDNAALFSVAPAINNTGVLTFTAAANSNGTATVTVVVQDNGGTGLVVTGLRPLEAVPSGGVDKSTNTFTINVTPVNDAPSVTFAQSTVTVLEDAGAQSTASFATFSAGPANESSQTLVGYTVTVDNAALFSVAPAINTSGVLTFTAAANSNGTATVTVVVQDNGGTGLVVTGLRPLAAALGGGVDKSTNTFTINVTAVNDAPVAVNDSYSVSQGEVLTVSGLVVASAAPAAMGVLANDTDIENDTLSATRLTDAAQGPVALNANGSFTYTPNTNFYGTDSFTYRASDASSNSNPATVSILVRARPTNAVPIAQSIFSGATLRFSATNLPVANGIRVGDPDSTTLTVSLTVTNGTVTVSNLTGLTFFQNRTNGTNVLLTGLTADVNNALESLAYASKVNFFGDETLHILTSDEGGRTNRGNGTVSILVEIPTLGGVPKVSLESLNDPMTGRMITNVTGLVMDTNLVQGISFDSVSNVVNVLPVGGQDGSTNRSTITVRVMFSDGTTRDVVVPVIIYQPLLAATTNAGGTYNSTFGTPLFNYQTSLYEQKVRVQNNTPFDFTALRITATNLPATVTLQNATLTNGGQVYIDYNLPIISGSNVTLKLEYFSSDLRTFTPSLKLELLNTTRTNTAPPGAVMTSVAPKTGYSPDGTTKNYLYFPSTVGQRYYVQYFDTVTVPQVWKTSGVVIPGNGLEIHWMDDGPPSTETPPGPLRFYRVVTDR